MALSQSAVRVDNTWGSSLPLSFLLSMLLMQSCSTVSAPAELMGTVITINKYSDGFDPAYEVILGADRSVSYVGVLGPHVVRRNLQLSPDENDAVLREIDPARIHSLASRPLSPALLGNGFADISVLRHESKMTIHVDPESRDQMQLFRVLEAGLRIRTLGCPFMVDVKGVYEDWCMTGPEHRRKAFRGGR